MSSINSSFSGRVSEIPYLTKDDKMLGFSVNGVKIFTSPGRKIFYGDLVKINVETHSNASLLFFPQIQIMEMARENLLLRIVNDTRNKFQKNFQLGFGNSQEGQLLNGIVLGNSKGFDSNLWQKLKSVGVAHIAAASGMNIVIVTKMTTGMLGALGVLGILEIQMATIAITWFYALLAGGSASVLRAATMLSFACMGILFGRPNGGAIALFWAVIFMLFWNPFYIFDIGFQLSVAATAGIILLNSSYNFYNNYNSYKEKLKQTLKSNLDTTIAATLATAPLIWWHFRTVPWVGIITNFLAVWTVDIVMKLGLLIGVFGPIRILVWPVEALLRYFLWIVSLFGQ